MHTKCRCRNCLYSVGSDCTIANLSTQESMPDYSFSQSEADTILISILISACICCIGYSGPVVIDSAETDIYVAAAISQKLPGLLCIKRKQATILCHNLVPADCIVPLHCLTGCDANSARVNSLDIEEEKAIEEFTQDAKWKAMKKKPPIACVNIAFVLTTWPIWCITPP